MASQTAAAPWPARAGPFLTDLPAPCPSMRQVQEHGEAGRAFDQRADRRAAKAENEVTFPRAPNSPVTDSSWAVADHQRVGNEGLAAVPGASEACDHCIVAWTAPVNRGIKHRMPTGRMNMRRIRDVLRLKYGQGLSERHIAASIALSKSSVGTYLHRARRPMPRWRSITARPSCWHSRVGLATRPRSKSPLRSRIGRSWLGCPRPRNGCPRWREMRVRDHAKSLPQFREIRNYDGISLRDLENPQRTAR